MSTKSPIQRRKRPQQERSREMVDAILEAAARVFVANGLDGANTNLIAQTAGVSVGSLYQYFPNKEALARELLIRHVQEAEALLPAPLRGDTEVPLRERISIAVRWYLDIHAREPELHETLTLIAPRVMGMEAIRTFERLHQQFLRGVLELHRDELGDRDLDLAAFVVSRTMESLTHGAVLHHADRLSDEALANEISNILLKYLDIA